MSKGINKIMGFMKLNDNEYEDIDEYEDDIELEDEEEEVVPKRKSIVGRGISRTKKAAASGMDVAPDDYSDIDLEEEETPIRRTQSNYSSSRKSSRRNNNIFSMPGSGAASRAMEVRVAKPSEFNSCQEISDIIISGRAAIINFAGVTSSEAQRIIDFVSGVCYAIGGDARPVSDSIIVVTPRNIDITGDLQEMAESGVEVPSFSFDEDEE